MNPPRPAIDIAALKRVERVYRDRLAEDPGDLVARTGLAWCLFIQALHQAGQESILGALMEAGGGEDAAVGEKVRAIVHQDARHVLNECLRQTLTVMQLSRTPEEQEGVERLEGLIRLSGADQAVTEAEQETARMLVEVAHALTQQEEPRTRRRTRPRRRDAQG